MFQVDQLSVALLASILVVLVLVKYLQHFDQPILHPLILARQAEASQVHAPGDSATYRNINAPIGFDLAMRPQRAAPDVASLLHLGVTGDEANHARRVLDMSLSNMELRQQAAAFAQGIQGLLQGAMPTIVVYGSLTSARSLIAMVAGAVSGLSFPTFVVPDGAALTALPAGIDANHMVVVCVDATAPLPAALQSATMSVVVDSESSRTALGKTRTVHFDDVLGQATDDAPALFDRSQLRSAELDALGAKTFATFYDPVTHTWLRATNTAMTSGVTAWLSEYPPEKIPGKNDTILTDAYAAKELPAPAFVTLALTALYTGAALASEPSKEILYAARVLKPTLLYLSPQGASQVEFALWLPATGALLNWLTHRVNTYALRNGRFPRGSILDRIVSAPLRRAVGLDHVRALFIQSDGTTVDQATLDQLRLYLAGPVMHTYVPMTLVRDDTFAIVTAPVAATNMYDLQAFAPQLVDDVSARRLAPHVGPPAVTVEVKLVKDTAAVRKYAAALERIARDEVGTRGDPVGEVYVRGYALAQSTEENTRKDSTLSEWYATGDVAMIRTNGTLVLVGGRYSQQAGVPPDFTLDPSGGKLPEMDSVEPSASDKNKEMHGSKDKTSTAKAASRVAIAPTALAMLALCAAPALAYSSTLESRAMDVNVPAYVPDNSSLQSHPFHGLLAVPEAKSVYARWTKRELKSVQASAAPRVASQNATMYNLALTNLLTSQRASWEQGVTQSAILETYYPNLSAFHKTDPGKLYSDNPSKIAVPTQLLSLAYHSIAAQDRNGRLATVVTGDEALSQGASQDSASCGEGVLLGAWFVEGFTSNNQPDSNGFWGGAVTRQLNYLMRNVSRSSNGVLSQRAAKGDIQFWSDQAYMGPPFLTQYALMTNNVTLYDFALAQIQGVRNGLALRTGSGKGLWGHILNYTNANAPRWIDERPWLTGNAWATAGILRMKAGFLQSKDQGVREKAQKFDQMVDEILDAAYPYVDEKTGLFHNVINDTRTFLDGSGSALMAYSVFRYGSMNPTKRERIPLAEKTYQTLQKSLDPYGTYTNGILTVNELSSNTPGSTSTESLAFLALLSSARRDYYAGNVTGSNGSVAPPPGAEAPATDDDKKASGAMRSATMISVHALVSAALGAVLLVTL